MLKKTLADYGAPYPTPSDTQKRYVIYLDEKEEDAELNDYKVQLIPGRIERVDGANRHFIGGKIKTETVQGWGYDYMVVTLGPVGGTLMMPMGDAAEKKPRFVAMSNSELIRYNSKLPIVVITPKDCVLRYRIWTCSGAESGGARGFDATEE